MCAAREPRAWITWFKWKRDRLIWMPSCWALPSVPARLVRSDPARSTNVSFGRSTAPPGPAGCPAAPVSAIRISMDSTACDRDECSFILVHPVVRLAVPRARSVVTSAALSTNSRRAAGSDQPPESRLRLRRDSSPSTNGGASKSWTESS
eukprot:scaffold6021_cov117-Isochrysis_galbana.AAC.21